MRANIVAACALVTLSPGLNVPSGWPWINHEWKLGAGFGNEEGVWVGVGDSVGGIGEGEG